MEANTLIVAGATGYGAYPPNSIEGVERCLAAPIDGIEIDALLTADGQVVAHHDYWLGPDATRLNGEWLAERGPAIGDLTLDQLQAYDIGRLRPGSEYEVKYPGREVFDGARIPTFDAILDTLRRAAGRRRLIYIEMKTDPQDRTASPAPDAFLDAVLRIVEAADYVEHTKIIAFEWALLRAAKERNPAIATAHLTIPTLLLDQVRLLPNGDSPWLEGFDAKYHGGSEIAAIKAHGGMEWSLYVAEVTPESVAEAHSLGLKVGAWGLSASQDIQRMAELGLFSATVSGPDWQ